MSDGLNAARRAAALIALALFPIGCAGGGVASAPSVPADAQRAIASGGPGGGGAAGGGVQAAPALVNYKLTGTVAAPPGCPGTLPLGADVCNPFATGTPFTLTYTVDTSAKANLQKSALLCRNASQQLINTTRSAALYSKAVSNINLQLATGVTYSTGAQSADVTLENDTCAAAGFASIDTYRIDAKQVSGLNFFPSFDAVNTAAVSFSLVLQEDDGPTSSALTSLNLATASPETNFAAYNFHFGDVSFRYPTTGQISFSAHLNVATLQAVP